MKSLTLLTCLGLVCGTLSAQESHLLTYGLGAGFTTPVGAVGQNLDTGWNIRAGGGVNFNRFLGVNLDVGYDSMGVNSTTLANVGIPGGYTSVFSLTLDPVVHLTPKAKADIYVTGGGGYFRQDEEFSQPSTLSSTGFYPAFGLYPGFTANPLVGSYSINKAGIDAGLGVNIKALGSGKLFAEARYDRVFLTNGYHSDFVPVTFGYRW